MNKLIEKWEEQTKRQDALIDRQEAVYKKLADASDKKQSNFSAAGACCSIEQVGSEIGNLALVDRGCPGCQFSFVIRPEFSAKLEIFQDNLALSFFQQVLGEAHVGPMHSLVDGTCVRSRRN